MKHLLTGVAVFAALAFSAPAWAQPASPSGGSPMEMPGPKASGTNYIPQTSHRRARAHQATHGRMAHGPKSLTDTADQLNRAELARLQAGSTEMPPTVTPPSSTRPGRMPAGGRKVD